MEQARIVFEVRPFKEAHQSFVDIIIFDQFKQLVWRLDAPVLADTQEDDPVNGHLDGEIELAFIDELLIAQGNIARQKCAPGFNILKEGIINPDRALLGGVILGIFIEGTLSDRIR